MNTYDYYISLPIDDLIKKAWRISDLSLKEKVYDWMFENHYIPKARKFFTLTDKLKRTYSSKACSEYISKKVFGDNKIPVTIKSKIISERTIFIIRDLHKINASLTGSLLDYYSRICLSKRFGIKFIDMRANGICSTEMDKLNIVSSYKKIQNGEYSLMDVFVVSLCHSLSFGDLNMEIYDSFISGLHLLTLDDFCEIEHFWNSIPIQSIILNPSLSHKTILADGDVIYNNDTLIDIKCTSVDKNNYEFLQLFGYSSLAKKRGINIQKMGTVNFYTGEMSLYDLEGIQPEAFEKFIEFL